MKIETGYPKTTTAADEVTARALSWEAPLLPSLGLDTKIGRWKGASTWSPPDTHLIVRHKAQDGSGWRFTNSRTSPPGYEIDFDLGLVHAHAQPGTKRLLSTPTGFVCTPVEGDLADGYRGLGHVEAAPLPMLEGLEVRRDRRSGQLLLVCGVTDPLYTVTEYLTTVGFIESYPIHPRQVRDLRVERHVVPLRRSQDGARRRHVYTTVDGEADGAVTVAGVWDVAVPGFVPLRRHRSGLVSSDLLRPGGRAARPASIARWTAAPLGWGDGALPKSWGMRAAVGRARGLPKVVRPPRRISKDATVLGYVRAEPMPGWTPLFSATHPVTGDQYLTRSEIEATDMGYVIDGVLGYVAGRGADDHLRLDEVAWASRFGHRRRYVVGVQRMTH